MNESIPKKSLFEAPDIYAEYGEFDRVGEEFGFDGATLMYLAKQNGKVIELSDEMWSKLENSDSFDIEEGDWVTVEAKASQVPRDYLVPKGKIERGETQGAPIVFKINDTLHLVSGNTRLMVARAFGLKPQVYLFEVDSHEE